MSKLFHWLALWDFESSRWRPLGCARSVERMADLVPPHVRLGLCDDVHLGTVVCSSPFREDAERKFGRLSPPTAPVSGTERRVLLGPDGPVRFH